MLSSAAWRVVARLQRGQLDSCYRAALARGRRSGRAFDNILGIIRSAREYQLAQQLFDAFEALSALARMRVPTQRLPGRCVVEFFS